MDAQIRICSNVEKTVTAVFDELIGSAQDAIANTGAFRVALSGGSTPRRLYRKLAHKGPGAGAEFDRWHIYFGDARMVPPTEKQSNYRMVSETLLTKVPIPAGQVYRIRGEANSASEAAQEYAATLAKGFRIGPGESPRFDLVLLGLGTDGHIASLFPHTSAVHETHLIVAANWVPRLASSRVTLTVPTINAARRVAFLVCGERKRKAVQGVFSAEGSPNDIPARLVNPNSGQLHWFLDDAAAELLR